MLTEAAGDHGSGDAGGRLRAERQRLASLIDEGIHLLGHDVGGVAQGPLEDFGEFEDRRGHFEIAIALRRGPRGLDHAPESAHVLGHEIVSAADRLQVGQDFELRTRLRRSWPAWPLRFPPPSSRS